MTAGDTAIFLLRDYLTIDTYPSLVLEETKWPQLLPVYACDAHI